MSDSNYAINSSAPCETTFARQSKCPVTKYCQCGEMNVTQLLVHQKLHSEFLKQLCHPELGVSLYLQRSFAN